VLAGAVCPVVPLCGADEAALLAEAACPVVPPLTAGADEAAARSPAAAVGAAAAPLEYEDVPPRSGMVLCVGPGEPPQAFSMPIRRHNANTTVRVRPRANRERANIALSSRHQRRPHHADPREARNSLPHPRPGDRHKANFTYTRWPLPTGSSLADSFVLQGLAVPPSRKAVSCYTDVPQGEKFHGAKVLLGALVARGCIRIMRCGGTS